MSDQSNTPSFYINTQYIKDLSFENPNAPQSLVGQKEQPDIKISVDVNVTRLEANAYEVALIISANAKSGDTQLFIAELTYAGIFTVNVSDEEKEPLLMIYCPGILFPFARRVIADSVRDGGFPPLMLEPIDFASLYQQHKNAGEQNQNPAND